MTGLIRFDDEHIVEFVLDAETQTIALKIIDPVDTYEVTAFSYAVE